MRRGMRCKECGSVLRDRPDSCPLCGSELGGKDPRGSVDAEKYQDNVRKLREELDRLRKGEAEAV